MRQTEKIAAWLASRWLRRILPVLFLWCMVIPVGQAHAARVKELASVQGVRGNQLIGYGLVVGLDGTGDGNMVVIGDESGTGSSTNGSTPND